MPKGCLCSFIRSGVCNWLNIRVSPDVYSVLLSGKNSEGCIFIKYSRTFGNIAQTIWIIPPLSSISSVWGGGHSQYQIRWLEGVICLSIHTQDSLYNSYVIRMRCWIICMRASDLMSYGWISNASVWDNNRCCMTRTSYECCGPYTTPHFFNHVGTGQRNTTVF